MVQTSIEYKEKNENMKKMATALMIIASRTKTKKRKIENFLTGSNRIISKTLYNKILTFMQEETQNDVVDTFYKYLSKVLINSFDYEELSTKENLLHQFSLEMIPRKEKFLYQLCCKS